MVCNSCNGTGEKPCEMCGGHGQIRVLQRALQPYNRCMGTLALWLGIPTTEIRTCGKCLGTGKVPCTDCSGTGKVNIETDT